MRLFWRVESAKTNKLTTMSDRRLIPTTRSKIGTTREPMVNSARSNRVPPLLEVITHPQVLPSVVVTLAVAMIHLILLSDRNPHHHHDDAVDKTKTITTNANRQGSTGDFSTSNLTTVARVPHPHRTSSLKVLQRTTPPTQLSSLRLVFKALQQELPRWQRLDGAGFTNNTRISFNTHATYGFEVSGRVCNSSPPAPI